LRDCVLSIAICTFNRVGLLDQALASFAAIAQPSVIPFELLVIDNNSRDQTRAVVAGWAARSWFPLRYVFEGRQGLSRARNLAAETAVGSWLWYVDDDVYFSPGWLEGASDAVSSFPDACMIAGRVVPAFEPAPPSWLPPSVFGYYGITDFGNEPRRLETTEYPVGANMAIRRSVLKDVGPFRDDLGRVAAMLRSSEESALANRLHELGRTIRYAPRAEVRHRIRQDRATMAWLRRRAYWGGISSVLTEGTTAPASRVGRLRRAIHMVRWIASDVLREGVERERQIAYAWRLGKTRQYLVEAARMSRPRIDPSVS
jgi:glycosyltransferase involved in cell wall biosynthesis